METLIVISIIGFALTGLLGLTSFSLNASSLTKQNFEADNLAQEAMEQIRSFRDSTVWDTDGLGTITANTDLHIAKSETPPAWQFFEGTESVGGFVRKIRIEEAERDASGNIVETGGVPDPDSKKIIVSVSWQERGKNHEMELITYLTNWR